MTARPGDEMPAGTGRSRLRACHADREQVIDVLKAAFVQGRLGKDEFDARVSQTFASQTCAELAPLTADIPGALIEATPPRTPARPAMNPAVPAGAGVIVATFMMVGATAYDTDATNIVAADTVFAVALITFMVSFVVWAWIFSTQPEKRSRVRPPQRSAGPDPRFPGGARPRAPA